MAVAGSLLLLTYEAGAVPAGGAAVFASPAAPVKRAGKDAAGHSFHAFALRQSGFFEEPEEEPEPAEPASAKGSGRSSPAPSLPDDDKPPPGVQWKSRGRKKKAKEEERPDLYALLGLQHERWTATDNQIKNAYRKVALEKHPDKAGAAVADAATKFRIEEAFKQVQEAYETLSDPARRREFDSTDTFDDSLPADCAPADFFKVFGPAFRRNSRWSVHQPVPGVGEEGSEWRAVDAFYDFWFQFKSWREFPHPDEEDLEQAECREEKRWLERHNAKLREAGKKEEKKRLKQFVEDAYKCDPRVIAHREQERAERERKKREKAEAAAAKTRAEEAARAEAEAAAAERAARAAEEAAEAKKARGKEKKLMQKERSRLRTLCSELGGVDDYGVEMLCSRLPLEGLLQITGELTADGKSDEQRRAFMQEQMGALDGLQASGRDAREQAVLEAERAAAMQRKHAAEAKAAKARAWSEEEVRMLEKALAKFPQGTAKRWEQVAAAVRTRSVEEVVDMVKHGLKAGRAGVRPNGITLAKKRQGNTVINSAPSQRHEAFTDVAVNANGPAASSSGNSNGGGRAEPQPPATPDAAAEAGAPAAASPSKDGWSDEQELALVKALRQYGKELPDRWDRIALAVPGQSKAACMRRFKALREALRANKS